MSAATSVTSGPRCTRSGTRFSARKIHKIDSPGHAGCCPRVAFGASRQPTTVPEQKEEIRMSFEMLGLAAPITRALAEERYSAPTPIQAKAIPPALEGRDLVGIAQTGTGKTAAFALPILHHLAARPVKPEPKSVRVLVLTPTRELASQIVDSFQTYGRHLSVSVRIAIGGVPIGKQIRGLSAGADVLVATPGRLMDLHRSRAVRLDRVAFLVLDEADRMLDMGFINDVRKIVAMVPQKRQTLLQDFFGMNGVLTV